MDAGGDGGGGREDPAEAARPFAPVAILIGVGLFFGGLGWPGLIGRIPFGLLLKNELGLPARQVAGFWAVGTAAWYLKPAVGLLCDAWPLFGTRRRGYLLVGAATASAGWLAFGLVPRSFGGLLVAMTIVNLGLVVVSAAIGGLLVEEGQRRGATGRLSALRTGLEGTMYLVAGPIGGALALVPLTVASGVGTAIVGVIVPATLVLGREERRARGDRGVWREARRAIATMARSRAMWTATLLMFAVFVTPGLQTPLLYYQQDALWLSPRVMGLLQLAGGAGAILGALAYAWLCRRLPLRISLVGGICLSAGAALAYLGYRSAGAAIAIDFLAGFTGALGTLPVFDLATRAAPRGCESLAFSLMMSVRTVALFVISDPLGSMVYERFEKGFRELVLVNAGSTLVGLLFVLLVPRALLAGREGQR
ncbi:MAG TPA: MFS transporter [Polyangia bacterium]